MEFGQDIRRPPRESVVPMINVVFLLLVFFLMAAQIAPPEPFSVEPPEAGSATPVDVGDTLYAGAGGALAYGTARGEAVFAALGAREEGAPLLLRADAAMQGAALTSLLRRLENAGQGRVTLVVRP